MEKSTAIESARAAVVSQPDADVQPIWLNFREIPSTEVFHRKTFGTAKWKEWLGSEAPLTLVIDAIDEGLLKVPDFIP